MPVSYTHLSSLKYQLIDMDGEKVLCKGLCERIGMESSMITHEANCTKATTPATVSYTHLARERFICIFRIRAR